MKAIFKTVVLAITCLLCMVSAITITENTVENQGIDLSEDINISPGIDYSIENNVLTKIIGDVDNEGVFYINSSGGIESSVTLTAGSFLNNGILTFDGLKSTVGSFFNIQPLAEFTNNGQIFLGVSNGGLVNKPFNLGSGLSFTNRGNIVLESASGQAAANIGTQNSVENHGNICLFNTIWSQSTSISGNGCTTVGPGSQLNVQGLSTFSRSQTIYLSLSTSQLNILGLSDGILSDTPNYNVVGFGGGNTISLTFIFTNINYSDSTGVLKLSTKDPILGITLSSMKITIGPGYTASGFKISSSGILGITGKSITYQGPAPNGQPNTCSCVFTFPSETTATTTQLVSVTSTSYWTEQYTSTTEAIPVEGGTVSVIVVLPPTTHTSYWTQKYTATTTLTPFIGSQPTVIVQVPQATTFAYWSQSYTSITTLLPQEGVQPTVVFQLPQATSTSFWSKTYTSTRTNIPVNGGQPTVIVERPTIRTSTLTWTGKYTITSNFIGLDGAITPVVEVPTITESTTTSTWASLYRTTSTLTGTDGVLTPIVKVPKSTSSEYSYEPTFISTNSEGYAGTNSSFVATDTHSAGSLTDSTSLFSHTKYNTTFVSTKSDSPIGVDSGTVLVTSEAAQSMKISTSFITGVIYSVPGVPSWSSTGFHNTSRVISSTVSSLWETTLTTKGSGTAIGTVITGSGIISPTPAIPGNTTVKIASTMTTITLCSENRCSKSTITAIQGPTTVTVNDKVSVYYTWCSVTFPGTANPNFLPDTVSTSSTSGAYIAFDTDGTLTKTTEVMSPVSGGNCVSTGGPATLTSVRRVSSAASGTVVSSLDAQYSVSSSNIPLDTSVPTTLVPLFSESVFSIQPGTASVQFGNSGTNTDLSFAMVLLCIVGFGI